jgi:hypothetical protein
MCWLVRMCLFDRILSNEIVVLVYFTKYTYLQFAHSLGITFVETSAADGTNVDDVFLTMALLIKARMVRPSSLSCSSLLMSLGQVVTMESGVPHQFASSAAPTATTATTAPAPWQGGVLTADFPVSGFGAPMQRNAAEGQQHDTAQAERTSLQAQSHAQMAALQMELEAAQRDAAAAKAQCTVLQSQLEASRAELSAVRDEVQHIAQERDELRGLFEAAQRERDAERRHGAISSACLALQDLNEFEVVQLLGVGSFAVVLKCRPRIEALTRLVPQVALKFMVNYGKTTRTAAKDFYKEFSYLAACTTRTWPACIGSRVQWRPRRRCWRWWTSRYVT